MAHGHQQPEIVHRGRQPVGPDPVVQADAHQRVLQNRGAAIAPDVDARPAGVRIQRQVLDEDDHRPAIGKDFKKQIHARDQPGQQFPVAPGDLVPDDHQGLDQDRQHRRRGQRHDGHADDQRHSGQGPQNTAAIEMIGAGQRQRAEQPVKNGMREGDLDPRQAIAELDVLLGHAEGPVEQLGKRHPRRQQLIERQWRQQQQRPQETADEPLIIRGIPDQDAAQHIASEHLDGEHRGIGQLLHAMMVDQRDHHQKGIAGHADVDGRHPPCPAGQEPDPQRNEQHQQVNPVRAQFQPRDLQIDRDQQDDEEQGQQQAGALPRQSRGARGKGRRQGGGRCGDCGGDCGGGCGGAQGHDEKSPVTVLASKIGCRFWAWMSTGSAMPGAMCGGRVGGAHRRAGVMLSHGLRSWLDESSVAGHDGLGYCCGTF